MEKAYDKETTCLIWDAEGLPPKGPWKSVVWSSFEDDSESDVISLPRFLEQHSTRVKANYLAWVYELGERCINGKRLIDHFELRPGLSYWWLLSLSHKPNFYQSQHITIVAKCLAFEHLCKKNGFHFRKIELLSANRSLSAVFKHYCIRRGIKFTCRPIPGIPANKPVPKSISSFIPRTLKACLYLFDSVMKSGHSTLSSLPPNLFKNQDVILFDILVHLNPEAFSEGVFSSNYWTRLPELMKRMNLSTTWIHTYYRHHSIESLREAHSIVGRFNRSSNGGESHILLDSLLSPRVAKHAIMDYIRLSRIPRKILEIDAFFTHNPSQFDFWPLFKKEWYDSLRGPSAMRNCIVLNEYEALLKIVPRQALGIYIQENQPWEMALIYSWRAAGHGKLLGVPHTTVRYWDLRYFYDHRTYAKTGINDLPRPDFVCLNGRSAIDTYLQAGYPKGEVVEVEALRYFHLGYRKKDSRRTKRLDRSVSCVGICGDNIPGSNEKVFRLLQAADRDMPGHTRYMFKAHKARLFDASKYGLSNLTVFTGDIAELFRQVDVIVTGNVSSAAVDAFCSGVPVISLLDPETLNASPLRGMDHVTFFSSEDDLADLLKRSKIHESHKHVPYFCLDEELKRWQRIIGALTLPWKS